MVAQIKHKVGNDTVVFNVVVEQHNPNWKEYLEFEKGDKLKASNGEEVLEVWYSNIVLRTPNKYKFNVVRMREKPPINRDDLRVDWQYRRLDEVRRWLTYGKSTFQFGVFAALGHVLIAVDSYALTITIYALNEDEVII